jgi:hypothetical protein
VNIQAILKSSPGYAKAESTFSKELEGYRSEVQKLQAGLDSAAQDFEAQSTVLSPRSGPRSGKIWKPAGEAPATHPGAAAEGGQPGAGAARPDPDPGETA